MRRRSFGKTGWQVSEIGFGAWQLGGTWGAVDESDAVDTLLHAFTKGVNFVDTAVLYGQGQSERLIGRALREWRDGRIHVATKIPPRVIPDPDAPAPMRGAYDAAHLRKHVDDSLMRLGVEKIDLLQLHHWIPAGTRELDWLETLVALRQEGKIECFGVSLRDIRPAQGVELAELGFVHAIQVMFNLFEQEPAEDLFPAASRSNTAIIARVPLDSGSLTGTWNASTYATWSDDDKRKTMYRGKRFGETLRRVEALHADLREAFPDLAEAAIRYALHPPEVGTVLCGMRDRREVDLNTRFADGRPFPEELLQRIRKHAWRHAFYE